MGCKMSYFFVDTSSQFYVLIIIEEFLSIFFCKYLLTQTLFETILKYV